MTIDEATILVAGATDGRGRRVVHGRTHKRVDTQAHDHAARERLQALTERLCCLVGGRPVARTTHRQGALP